MNFDIISASLKKAFDVFVANIVAYIVGFLIMVIGSIFIVTFAPLMYGMYYMVLKGTRGEKPEIKDVFYALTSINMFIRSWIGVIVVVLPFVILGLLAGMIVAILTFISTSLILLAIPIQLIVMVICLVLAIFVYFSLYIYVMTPAENIVYAIKTSIGIGKANIIMVIITLILSALCGILIVTAPIGYLFAVYVLKELEPSIKDQS
jgi:hypothetical protein